MARGGDDTPDSGVAANPNPTPSRWRRGAPPPRPARPRGGGRPAGGRPPPGGPRRFTLRLDFRHVGTDDPHRDEGMDGHAAARGRQRRRRRPCCGGYSGGAVGWSSFPPPLSRGGGGDTALPAQTATVRARPTTGVRTTRPLSLSVCPRPGGYVEASAAWGCAGAEAEAVGGAPRQVSVRAPRGLHDELLCLTQRVHAAAEHPPHPPSLAGAMRVPSSFVPFRSRGPEW